ncbi:MAG: CHAT domain-containing protein [Terriglobales bacterium]
MSAPPQSVEIEALVEQMSSLLSEDERRAFVEANPSLRNTEVLSSVTNRVLRQIRVSTADALRLADAAVTIAEALNTPAALAEGLRSRANALYGMGQNAAAAELHARAAELFEQAGDRDQLARTLSTSIQPLSLMGCYDRALAAGERAREIFREQGNLWRLARVELNIGNIYYRQDRFQDALQAYQRAYTELLKHDDAEGIAGALSNLAVCNISLNNFTEALANNEEARSFSAAHQMPLLVVQADYNIAYLHFLRGEYGRAIEMLRAARVKAKDLNDGYHGALCNLDLSEIYLELNLHAEAAELADSAHAGFETLGMAYESAKSLAFSAIACSQLGQPFQALERFAKAREVFLRENNLVWPSLIDLYQALVLLNEGRLFEARRLALAAYESFRSSFRSKAVLAQLLLARVTLSMRDAATSLEHCRTALAGAEELQLPVLIYQAEFVSGQIYGAMGNANQAYESYRRAQRALETLRGNLRGEELKISFFKNKLEVYENLVIACLADAGNPQKTEEAFGYIEQAKSRSLMDMLLQPIQRQGEEESGQSELVRNIKNLREELNWYYNLIEREQLRPEEKSQQRVELLERQVRARETDLLRVLQEASLSEAGQAGIQLPTHLPLAEIRQALPAEAALVEYFLVQDRFVACIVTQDSLEIAPVTFNSRIQSLLRLVQFQMSKFHLDTSYLDTFKGPIMQATQAHLRNLYAELIAPIEPVLRASHLIFVPHGVLHYVPFQALFDGSRYLIDRFTISYAPSASIFSICQRLPASQSQNSLLMGIPDALAPSIGVEVEALKSILPNAVTYIGNDATESALRRHGPDSRIVHIATHGQFRQDNPMFSSIRLAGSFLSLYDLYQLKLPAELVVLSGCATGLNVVTAGDELMGMVRGLLQAGAQSLVLSLWDVHDRSTAEFMVTFYQRLQSGASKAEALKSAMTELREKYPHPYHWAPFVLIGRV